MPRRYIQLQLLLRLLLFIISMLEIIKLMLIQKTITFSFDSFSFSNNFKQITISHTTPNFAIFDQSINTFHLIQNLISNFASFGIFRKLYILLNIFFNNFFCLFAPLNLEIGESRMDGLCIKIKIIQNFLNMALIFFFIFLLGFLSVYFLEFHNRNKWFLPIFTACSLEHLSNYHNIILFLFLLFLFCISFFTLLLIFLLLFGVRT